MTPWLPWRVGICKYLHLGFLQALYPLRFLQPGLKVCFSVLCPSTQEHLSRDSVVLQGPKLKADSVWVCVWLCDICLTASVALNEVFEDIYDLRKKIESSVHTLSLLHILEQAHHLYLHHLEFQNNFFSQHCYLEFVSMARLVIAELHGNNKAQAESIIFFHIFLLQFCV